MVEQGVWLLDQLGYGVLCLAGILVLVWITSLVDGGHRRRMRGREDDNE